MSRASGICRKENAEGNSDSSGSSIQVNGTENVVEPSENCFNVQSFCYCTAISMMLMKRNKMWLAKETHLL